MLFLMEYFCSARDIRFTWCVCVCVCVCVPHRVDLFARVDLWRARVSVNGREKNVGRVESAAFGIEVNGWVVRSANVYG